MHSILEILDKSTAYLSAKGVPDPKLDAQIMLAHSLGCKRLELFLRFDEPMTEQNLAPFRELVRRRAKREPLQHIIGSVDFFGVKIKCDSRALIPRPETEELCEIVAEELFPDHSAPLKILDLGSGTGAISLALAKTYPNSFVRAFDISEQALALAIENSELNGLSERVSFEKSDWYSKLNGENSGGDFDMIISNPPYLSESELLNSEPEVKNYDPKNALVADDNGLAALKVVLKGAPDYLKENGILACECGCAQAQLLSDFAKSCGFSETSCRNDLSKRQRFLLARFAK